MYFSFETWLSAAVELSYEVHAKPLLNLKRYWYYHILLFFFFLVLKR